MGNGGNQEELEVEGGDLVVGSCVSICCYVAWWLAGCWLVVKRPGIHCQRRIHGNMARSVPVWPHPQQAVYCMSTWNRAFPEHQTCNCNEFRYPSNNHSQSSFKISGWYLACEPLFIALILQSSTGDMVNGLDYHLGRSTDHHGETAAAWATTSDQNARRRLRAIRGGVFAEQ